MMTIFFVVGSSAPLELLLVVKRGVAKSGRCVKHMMHTIVNVAMEVAAGTALTPHGMKCPRGDRIKAMYVLSVTCC